MNFLADTPPIIYNSLVVPSLDGISLVIAAFFFYGLARPAIVKNRTQFWGVFGCVVGIILLSMLRLMLYNSPGGQVVTGILIGLVQLAAVVLSALCVGGLTARDMADEISDAVDDLRSGGTPKKTPIVPLTGERPQPREEINEETTPRYTISLPKKTDDRGPMPLD
jgi:hypothetical protein